MAPTWTVPGLLPIQTMGEYNMCLALPAIAFMSNGRTHLYTLFLTPVHN